jgi:hypothetical protein
MNQMPLKSMEPLSNVIARCRTSIDAAKVGDGQFAETCTVKTNDLVTLYALVLHLVKPENLKAPVTVTVKPPDERN